jgi:ASC-1-like (ASCH) protein
MFTPFLISQILIGIALVFDLASFQFKNRKRILICFAVAASLISTHFFLLGENTAGSVVALSAVRFVVSIFTTDKRLLWLFLGLILAAGVITFDGVEDVLSVSAMLLSTFSAFSAQDKRLRLFMMVASTLMITHNILIFTPAGIVLESFFLASNLFAYYRYYLKQKQHQMHLDQKPFSLIREGKKTIEVRLNDEKRQELRPNDLLLLVNREDESQLRITITAVHKYQTFKELFDSHAPEVFGGTCKEELLSNIRQFYSVADEQKLGVVGIELKLH